MDSVFIKPFPVRPSATGTLTLASGATDSYSGVNARQNRRTFIITNCSATLAIKVQISNAVNGITIWPQTNIGLDCDADFLVYNPNGNSVDYEVLELFYDEGSVRGGSLPAQRSREVAGGSGDGSGTSGSSSGGTTSGYGSVGGSAIGAHHPK